MDDAIKFANLLANADDHLRPMLAKFATRQAAEIWRYENSYGRQGVKSGEYLLWSMFEREAWK